MNADQDRADRDAERDQQKYEAPGKPLTPEQISKQRADQAAKADRNRAEQIRKLQSQIRQQEQAVKAGAEPSLLRRLTAQLQALETGQVVPGSAPASVPGTGAGPGAGTGGTETTSPATASSPTGNGYSYDAFNAAYKAVTGRDITQDQLNSNEFLLSLNPDLFSKLPIARLIGFGTDRLVRLPQETLLQILRWEGEIGGQKVAGWQLLPQMSTEQILALPKEYVEKEALPYLESVQSPTAANIRQYYTANPNAPAGGVTPGPGGAGAGGTTPPGQNPPGTTPPPEGNGTAPADTGPVEDIPTTHAWILEIGAQDWARTLRKAGFGWDKITPQQLRKDTADGWARKAQDPKYAALYQYAQQYFARTGFWPTEVELNKFTQNVPSVPNILPDGTVVPKGGGSGEPGEHPKWAVPKDATGNPISLPPGYEWRFSSDGTPVPFDNDQTHLDLFSGWYQDPKSGEWSYNPMLGAADYLQSKDQAWSDVVGGFVQQTGRLPSLQEARALAARVWAAADPLARKRAEQFAAINGFWPTPFELEYGAAKDQDANTGGGKAGQAGLGQVPVQVPGVGTVMVAASPQEAGGWTFDPFQGIPGNVRPWIREILNGRLTADKVPAELQQWVQYALGQFQSQMPVKRPEELPGYGIPDPTVPPGTAPGQAGQPAAPGANANVPSTPSTQPAQPPFGGPGPGSSAPTGPSAGTPPGTATPPPPGVVQPTPGGADANRDDREQEQALRIAPVPGTRTAVPAPTPTPSTTAPVPNWRLPDGSAVGGGKTGITGNVSKEAMMAPIPFTRQPVPDQPIPDSRKKQPA